jgi:Fe-S-cluster containining protein
MQELHDEEFKKTDCLQCANCCKTTGPLFTDKDIERIAKYFRLKPSEFMEHYLRLDEDNDYVLQSVPCSFLGADNYCSIYNVRPKACREFPHTDRKKFHQISNLTLKNVAICPAAFNIVEEMKKRIKTL